MQDNGYLSEERYQKNNTKVKKIGKILLIVGIVILALGFIFIIIGLLGFGNSAMNGFDSFDPGNGVDIMKQTASSAFGSFGLFTLGGFMDFLGFALTAVGGRAMFIAHRREITAYTTQQVMPVAQEGIEKITPTVANAAGSIAKSISQGIQEGKNDANNNN